MADTTDNEVTGGGDAGSAATATAVAASEAKAAETSTQNAEAVQDPNAVEPKAAAAAGAGGAGEGGEGGADKAGSSEVATGAPESYELTLQGELADPSVKDGLEGSFRKAGLTNEAASEFVDGFMPKLLEHQKAKAEAWKSDMDETLRADPEFIGKDGKGYDASVELRDKAIEAMPGGKQLLVWMKESGLVNQAGLAKAFRFVGEQFLAEDKVMAGGGKGNPKPVGADIPFDDAANILYPPEK